MQNSYLYLFFPVHGDESTYVSEEGVQIRSLSLDAVLGENPMQQANQLFS